MRLSTTVLLMVAFGLLGCGRPSAPSQPSSSAASKTPTQSALIVGKWKGVEDKNVVTLEFSNDGKLRIAGDMKLLASVFKFAKIVGDFEFKPESVPLTYDATQVGKLEIGADLTKLTEALGGDSKSAKSRETRAVTVNEKELTITSDEGKSLTFARVE